MIKLCWEWCGPCINFFTGTVIGRLIFFNAWHGQLLDAAYFSLLDRDSYWITHVFLFLTGAVIGWFSWQGQLLDGAYFYFLDRDSYWMAHFFFIFLTGTGIGWRIFLLSWQGQLLDGVYFSIRDKDSCWMAYFFLSINKRKAVILAEKLRHQVNG